MTEAIGGAYILQVKSEELQIYNLAWGMLNSKPWLDCSIHERFSLLNDSIFL
jgi:hypothetical protein